MPGPFYTHSKSPLHQFALAFLITLTGLLFWSCDLIQSQKTTQVASRLDSGKMSAGFLI